MPFCKTPDSTEIYYNDWGAGRPVVLIHGWPLSSAMWEKQTVFLAENGHRVISYDRRGFGRSSQPWDGYDYDTFAADLQALLENLDLRDATLVGFSMGGGEVVRYMSRYGKERVSRGVLLAGVPPFLLQTADNPAGAPREVFDEIARQLRADRPDFMRGFAKALYGESGAVSDAVLAWTEAMTIPASLRACLGAAHAWGTTDFRAEMKEIHSPVLVLHGTADTSVSVELGGRRSAEILSRATYSEFEGEPHGMFWTASERVNRELLEFLR